MGLFSRREGQGVGRDGDAGEGGSAAREANGMGGRGMGIGGLVVEWKSGGEEESGGEWRGG